MRLCFVGTGSTPGWGEGEEYLYFQQNGGRGSTPGWGLNCHSLQLAGEEDLEVPCWCCDRHSY